MSKQKTPDYTIALERTAAIWTKRNAGRYDNGQHLIERQPPFGPWRLFNGQEVIGDFPTLRAAKYAAQGKATAEDFDAYMGRCRRRWRDTLGMDPERCNKRATSLQESWNTQIEQGFTGSMEEFRESLREDYEYLLRHAEATGYPAEEAQAARKVFERGFKQLYPPV